MRDLPGAFSSPGWASPTPSVCHNRRDVPAHWSLPWLSPGPAPMTPCPSCPRGLRPELQMGPHENSHLPFHPFLFCHSPGYSWLSRLQAHSWLMSIWLFIHLNPQVLLSRAAPVSSSLRRKIIILLILQLFHFFKMLLRTESISE